MHLKKYAHDLAAKLTNKSVSLLRNKIDLEISREEFRESNISFSQFGEDLLILSYFSNYKALERFKGFYVDIGAFHPFKLSNTVLLYKLGWHGLNIDCDQDKIELFNRLRPRDINVCAAIANSNKEMTLLRYPMSATNRLSNKYADEQLSLCGEVPVDQLVIKTKSLETVLLENNLENNRIDYLNIDVEGMELEVLEGIDFSKRMPQLISIEIMNSENFQLINQFLEKYRYIVSGIVRHNYFFKKI